MKCVILCGGKGTRLREETEFKPKPLVQIGERPILWHIMKIYDFYGIKDFILTLGYKGEMIKRYFMEYRWRNNDFTLKLNTNQINLHGNNESIEQWNISCIETGAESGTSLRLFKIKKYLETEENFCLTYGDGVADVNIENLIQYHKNNKKIVTITGLHPRSKYGLMVKNKDQIVTDFREKPILPDTINGGFMVINRKIFKHMDDSNTMLVNSILPKLASLGEVIVYEFDGFWYSLDTYKDYEFLNQVWKKNPTWRIWDSREKG
jgi:glucose-1-phosphate cytidylyltransferase